MYTEEPENVNTAEFAQLRIKRALEEKEQEDLEGLAMAVALEARGEGDDGMFAVARSIHNRHRLINDGEVPPYTYNLGTNKKPSFMDIIGADNQYAVYDEKNKKFNEQDSPVTEEDLELARNMIVFARDDEMANFFVQAAKLPEEVLKGTGFRTREAKYDPSQDVGTFMVGDHQFNTAGYPSEDDE